MVFGTTVFTGDTVSDEANIVNGTENLLRF